MFALLTLFFTARLSLLIDGTPLSYYTFTEPLQKITIAERQIEVGLVDKETGYMHPVEKYASYGTFRLFKGD